MTNNIRIIKEFLLQQKTSRQELSKAVLMNDKEAILNQVCKSFINEVNELNYVSEAVFEKRVEVIIQKYEAYLQRYDIPSPDFRLFSNVKKLNNPF